MLKRGDIVRVLMNIPLRNPLYGVICHELNDDMFGVDLFPFNGTYFGVHDCNNNTFNNTCTGLYLFEKDFRKIEED